MKKKLWVCGLFGLLVLGLLVGCNEEESSTQTDGDTEENEPQPDGDDLDGDELDGDQEQQTWQGTLGRPCFDDGTCYVGLICEEGTCEADPHVTWVRIPGGTFWMGCGGEGTCTPENWAQFSKPRHQVTVPAFEMTQTEVTELQALIAGGNPPVPGRRKYPSICGMGICNILL